MALGHKATPSLLYGAGLVSVYLGERVLEPSRTSTAAVWLGLLAVGTALVLAVFCARKRRASRVLPCLYGVGLLALAMHFCRSAIPTYFGHPLLEQSLPRLDGALSVLWPGFLLVGILPVILVELSLVSMARVPVADERRVHAAVLAGLGTSFALVFCFAISYVAAERDLHADLSFFRTARLGSATKKLAAALAKPIEITLFYPPGNEVAEELASYFADLARASAQVTVHQVDQAVEPARAKSLGVTSNGAVAFACGTLHEQLQIPPKLDSARAKLRILDQEVNKRIVGVSRGKRTVYSIQGHEERRFTTPHDGDAGGSLGRLHELLLAQNLETRDLGLAQGLGNEVPADASLVLLVGPRTPLLAEETAALETYVQHGGRMLIAVDAEANTAAKALLAGFALELESDILANDRIFWARNHEKTDRTGIATVSYTTHPALSTLAQYGMQMPLVLLGAGALAKPTGQPTPVPKVDFIIQAEPSTWNDRNGNFEFDKESEARKPYPLAAAVTLHASGTPAGKEGRAFVLGDSDVLSDLLLVNRANTILARDAILWLLGDSEVAGTISNEEDVPVRHTRKQDAVWFYSSVFLAPTIVLLAGFLATRKRRTREARP